MSMPFVSVILPIRNESKYIDATLRSVLDQDYPGNRFEILIADGMSTDNTREIVGQLAALRDLPQISIVDNPGRIVPTGFNAALRRAKGDVIVRVDGHCCIEKDYVRRCVEVLAKTGADNVGGVQKAVGGSAMEVAIARVTSSPFGVGNARFHYSDSPGWVDTVFLGAWPKAVFARVGMFDEELVRNQDDEFNFRITQSGGKIWLDPSIKSVYFGRASVKSLWKQYYQYGFYKVRVIQKRQAVASLRHLVPSIFVVSWGAALTACAVLNSPLPLLVLLMTYLSAAVLASARAAGRQMQTIPLLVCLFAVIHFGYGVGFLFGICHWSLRSLRGSSKALPN